MEKKEDLNLTVIVNWTDDNINMDVPMIMTIGDLKNQLVASLELPEDKTFSISRKAEDGAGKPSDYMTP